MTTNTRARTWRVTLTDGRSLQLAGRKLIETQAGGLLIVGPQQEPARIIAAGKWVDCEELPREGSTAPLRTQRGDLG